MWGISVTLIKLEAVSVLFECSYSEFTVIDLRNAPTLGEITDGAVSSSYKDCLLNESSSVFIPYSYKDVNNQGGKDRYLIRVIFYCHSLILFRLIVIKW